MVAGKWETMDIMALELSKPLTTLWKTYKFRERGRDRERERVKQNYQQVRRNVSGQPRLRTGSQTRNKVERLVQDIWSCTKLQGIFDPCQKVLQMWSYQEHPWAYWSMTDGPWYLVCQKHPHLENILGSNSPFFIYTFCLQD